MSDLAHRFILRDRACVCGSDWNWLADTCSMVIPIHTYETPPAGIAEEDWDSGYFECRKGHAFCGRH
jgi:hypothetical protein